MRSTVSARGGGASTRGSRTAGRPGPAFYLVLSVAMMVLHQDFWFWTDKRLLLGWMPIGLAYQAVYSLFAAVVMALLVRWAWPEDLEDLEDGRQAEGQRP